MHAKPTHRKARPKARERGCAFRFGYNRSAKVVIPIKLCKFFHIRDFSAHQEITKGLKGVVVYFADSYCSWQKGLVEYTNKLIRQYIPKGTDFTTVTPRFVKKIQTKLNRRPREKLNFSTPTAEFFKHFR